MKISGITLLYFLLLFQTASEGKEVTIIKEKGENIMLPCLDLLVNTTPTVTRWKKGEVVLATHDSSSVVHSPSHITILDNSSLSINGLLFLDEAMYHCETEPGSSGEPHGFQLLITDGPNNMTVSVKPSTALPNGTLFVVKGASVTFVCSSESYPSQNLTWTYEDVATNENKTRAFGSKSSLFFEILNIQPADQRNYTCLAQNILTMKSETQRVELLVYYAPEFHPDCIWHHGSQLDQVLFNCSWSGAYPTPTLTVVLNSKEGATPILNTSMETENLELPLNRSMLYEGQKITCVGQHTAQKAGDKRKMCTFTLAAPYPEGQPMVAALEGTDITLTCSESKSLPPAITVWQRGEKREPIIPSSKYIVVKQGPILSLTIVNATRDDQGVYFCWSENVLSAKGLEVILTIRSSADKSGAVIGVFLSILILAAGISAGYFMYTHRDRICLGFSHPRDDNADVINLVESDEEDVFHDAVPRLPPVMNGYASAPATTLVEIHRIQSTDHEENGNDATRHTQDRTQDHTQPEEQ